MARSVETHYRREADAYVIGLRLGDLHRLFNPLDNSPYPERDLSPDAEDYIVGSVSDLPPQSRLKLVFELPPDTPPELARALPEAIHNYFGYRTALANRDLRFILRQGRVTLLIGLVFLAVCISASQLVARMGDGTLIHVFREGLLISGWVAMWKPVQIFLYDWWPIRRRLRLFHRIETTPVEVRIVQREPEPAARPVTPLSP